MLRLSELRLDLDHTEEDLEEAVLRCLRVPKERLLSHALVKRSIDARRRDRIRFIYSVDVQVQGEKALLRRRSADRRIRRSPDETYHYVARAPSSLGLLDDDGTRRLLGLVRRRLCLDFRAHLLDV